MLNKGYFLINFELKQNSIPTIYKIKFPSCYRVELVSVRHKAEKRSFALKTIKKSLLKDAESRRNSVNGEKRFLCKMSCSCQPDVCKCLALVGQCQPCFSLTLAMQRRSCWPSWTVNLSSSCTELFR